MPDITIVMPTYNVEKYLRKSIESVINQTFKNWILYVVIDGSLDNCGFIAEEYAKNDPRIKVLYKPNGGLSDARNVIIDICKTKYITFIDSDDYIAEDYLEILLNNMLNNNCDISTVSYCPFFEGEEANPILSNEVKVLSDEKAMEEMLYQKSTTNCAWAKLYKTTLFEDIRYPKGKVYEDIATTYKLFSKANKIAISSSQKYYYLTRKDSITKSKFNLKRMDALDFINEQSKFVKTNYPNLENAAINREFAEALYILKQLPKKGYEKEQSKLYEIIRRTRKIVAKDRNSRKYYRLMASLSYLPKWIFLKILRPKNKFSIKSLLSVNTKNMIRYYLSKSNIYDINLKNKKKVFICLASDYGNLGDCSMALAQLKFFKDLYPEYEIIEVLFHDVYTSIKSMKKVINNDDIIALAGGGHFGTLYQTAENMRRFIIKTFRKNKIISMPQTIDFSDDHIGNKSLAKTKSVYAKHPNLTIIARERVSYEIIKREFPNNKCLLSPDIAFYLGVVDQKLERSLIAINLRNDDEIKIDMSKKGDLVQTLRDKFGNNKVFITDTHIPNVRFNAKTRKEAVLNKWQQFGQSKVVIADRLHAMIFCAITNTPCIILPNKNGKIENTYNYLLKDLKYIKLIPELDISKILESISELEQYQEESKLNIKEKFEELKTNLK